MGSGIKRKKSDSPIIRAPKAYSFGGVNSTAANAGAEICVVSFDVKVTASYLTKPGVKVQLRKRDGLSVILIGENQIGSLNKRYSEMIVQCATFGIKYSGEIIIDKKKGVYARFFRVP